MTVIAQSFSGRKWTVERFDARLVEALAQRFDVPDVVARVMAIRGIGLDDAHDFLSPKLKVLLPDPLHLKDMDKAVARMITAIRNQEKICVFGDYDVDGATSSALLIRFCRAIGVPMAYYIPDRNTEGYGPNVAAMQKLAADQTNLVITVDCGSTAHKPLAAAKEAGMDVIVLDHHSMEAESPLPPAVAVVNPNRVDDASPHKHLAAVGVTFLFLVALRSKLQEQGFFKEREPPDLLRELDLVALGTVCDIVPLVGVNRAFVHQGLRVMGQTENIGIQALRAAAKNGGTPDTYTAGFVLGPRINAGGRIGKSDLGVRLLTSNDDAQAGEIAQRLNTHNIERQAMEAEIVQHVLASLPETVPHVAFVEGDGWYPGIVGLIASRVLSRFDVPTFATAFNGDIGKGSCRSVDGMDIGSAVRAAKHEGILIDGGGHEMAGGYTVARGAYPAFKQFMEERMAKHAQHAPRERTLRIDGLLTPAAATIELCAKLQALAPFGAKNREPRFAMMNVRLLNAKIVGENHVSLALTGDTPGVINAIAFRAMDNAIGPEIMRMKKGDRLNVAGVLRPNSYGMRESAQLIVDDAAPC